MEGDIENVDGVIRITTIRVHYRVAVDEDKRTGAEKALASYASRCPAYQSVQGCIEVSSTADWTS